MGKAVSLARTRALPTAIQRELQSLVTQCQLGSLGRQVAAVMWNVTRESSKMTQHFMVSLEK